MASSSTSGVPDLQHKLSKKIAQLTKVIYALHSKTEDHDMAVKDLVGRQEQEVDQIMQDAAGRLKSMKERLDTQDQDSKFRKELDSLKAQHASEKQRAVTELASLKKQLADRGSQSEATIAKERADMKKELDVANVAFSTKLAAFASATDAFVSKQASLEQELSRKHAAELKAAADAADSRLKEAAVIHERTTEQHKKQHSDAMCKMTDTHSTQLQQVQTEHVSVIDQLESKLANAMSRLQNVAEQTNLTAQSAADAERERLKMTQEAEQLRAQLAELEAQKCLSDNDCAKLQDDLRSALKQRDGLQESMREMQSLNKEMVVKLEHSDSKAVTAEALAAALQTELAKLRAGSDSDALDLRAQLAAMQETCKTMKLDHDKLTVSFESEKGRSAAALERVAELDLSLAIAQARVKELEAQLSASTSSNDQELLRIQKELRDACSQLKDSQQAVHVTTTERDALSAELKKLQLLLDQMSADHLKKVSAFDAERSSSASAAKSKFMNAVSQAKAEADKLNSDKAKAVDAIQAELDREKVKSSNLAVQLEKLQADLDSGSVQQKRSHEEALAQLRHEAQQKLEQIGKDHRNEIRLKDEEHAKQMRALEGSSAEQTKAWSAERVALQTKIDSLSQSSDESGQSLDKARADLQAKMKELQDCQSKCSSETREKNSALQEASDLKASVDDLEAKLKAMCDSMDASSKAQVSELNRLRQEKQAVASQLDGEHASDMSRLKSEMEDAIAALQKKHALELQALEDELSKALRAAKANAAAEAERTAEAERNLKQSMQKDLEAAVIRQQQIAADDKQQLEERLAAAYLQERQQMESAHADTVADIRHKASGDAQRAQKEAADNLKAELSNAATEAASDLEKQLSAAKKKHQEDMDELRASLLEGSTKSQDDLAAGYAAKLGQLQRACDGHLAELKQKDSELFARRKAVDSLTASLEGAQKAAEAQAQLLTQERASAQEDLRSLRSQLTSEHKHEMKRRADEAIAESRRAADKHQEEKQLSEQQLAALHEALAELQELYNTRDGRPEDLAEIARLKEREVALSEALAQAKEDMKWYKLELRNREENFNKTFSTGGANGVNVGVMNVVKTKPSGTPLRATSNNPKGPGGAAARSASNNQKGGAQRGVSASRRRPSGSK